MEYAKKHGTLSCNLPELLVAQSCAEDETASKQRKDDFEFFEQDIKLECKIMALSVKAYLIEQQEIRRFSIDEGASSNYDYLLTKIRTVFPGLRNKHLRLFWKDNDEELVTFSSHEELVEALGSMSGEVFRVFVKVLDGQEESGQQGGSESSSSPQPVHEGVVCDGCDVGIAGTRFKCVVCPDYDLCMKCEAKGLHKEHEMLRICTPRACPWFPGPFPFPPPHHGPRHHGPRHGFGPWGRGARFWGPRCGRGRCGGPRGRCGTTSDPKCNRHAETAAEDGQEVPVGPPFLHNLGETLASFLGPMGVEVHTYADNEQGCCQGNCTCKTDDKETEGTSAESSPQDTTETPESDQEQCPPSTGPMDTTPATGDYVLIDKDKHSEDTGTTSDKTNETTSGPDEADPLEVAIAKMRDMGFEDDNGWLSQLIVAKEYDIGKVLDAIQFEGKN